MTEGNCILTGMTRVEGRKIRQQVDVFIRIRWMAHLVNLSFPEVPPVP